LASSISFSFDEVGRDVRSLVVRRLQRGHVHGQATGQLDVAADQVDQHADLAVGVDVGADVVGGVDLHHAADLDVLTQGLHGGGAGFLDGAAVGQLGSLHGFDVGGARCQGGSGDGIDEGLEVVIVGDEVGFRVDFDQHGLAAVLGQAQTAFGGHAVSLLVGLGGAGLAHGFSSGVDVAVGFGERLLAFHHAGAGALAQFLDQGSSDFHGITSRKKGLGRHGGRPV
jgi:hypothetical protein